MMANMPLDPELLKAKFQMWAAIVTAAGTVLGAIIVGVFGTLITRKYSREKDRQQKEGQWRDHAIELTKLDLERKLKRYDVDHNISLRPSILDFLANYRDLLDLDKVSPKALYRNILENRRKEIGKDKADKEENV
jgi:hypothetical protein